MTNTENIKTKKILSGLESKYYMLFNSVYNGIIVYNPVHDGSDFLISECNEHARKIFNLPNDLSGLSISSIFPNENDFNLAQSLFRVWETDIPQFYTIHITRNDRLVIHCESYIYKQSRDELVVVLHDMTERKNTENELNKSKQFNETLLNTSPDIIYLFDIIKNTNIYNNNGFYEVLGYSQDEINELSCGYLPKLMHPDDFNFYLDNIFPKYQEAKGNEIIEYEYRISHKDGRWLWMHAKERVFARNEDDIPFQIFGVTNDITKRKIAENALIQNEKKYRSLFENMTDGFALHEIILDEKGNPIDYIFLEVNNAFESLTDLKADDIIGQKVTKVLPGIENDPADWIGKYGSIAINGSELRLDQYSKNLKKWFSVMAFSPEKYRFACIIKDITSNIESEERIKEMASYWQTTFDAMESIIFIMDQHGSIQQCNNKAQQYLKIQKNKMIGRKCWDIMHGMDQPIHNCPFMRMKSTHKKELSTIKLNDCWLEVSAEPIMNAKGKLTGAVHIINDITSRRKVEDELKNHRENLEKLVKDRTSELEEKNKELERMNNIFVEREFRIKELRDKIKELTYKYE